MEESEVEYHVKCLLEKHGWRKAPPEFLPFESDIVYVKCDERYIIEAKGETKGGPSWLSKYAIGETVARARARVRTAPTG